MISKPVSQLTLVVVVVFLCAVPAAGQAVWDLTPYQIDIIFAARSPLDFASPLQSNSQKEKPASADDERAGSVSAFERDLKREILVRTARSAAGFWDVSITSPSPRLRRELLADLRGISLQLLSQESKQSLERDKVMLLVVLPTTDGYEVVARELDVRTRIFSSPVRVRTWHTAKLADAAFLAVRKAFAPLAQILPVEGKTVELRLRAGGIPPRDDTLRPAAEGQLFRAVIRRNDRDGKLRGVFVVPWTFLAVENLTGSVAKCKLHTGLRSPLSGRRRGRIENLALAVIPPGGSTELVIRARTEPYQPLAGYDVFSQSLDGESSELLGRTNSEGRLMIPESEPPLRRVVVKHGGELMALLPMVPGLVWEPMLGFGRYQGQWPSTLPRTYLLGLLESVDVDESLRAAIEQVVVKRSAASAEAPTAEKSSQEGPKLTFGTYDGRAITEVPTQYLVGLLEEAAGIDAQSRTAIQYIVIGARAAGRPDLARATLEARVPDDDPRLEAEGYLIGVQGELVDVTISREILLTRARARIEEKKYDEARKLFEELKGLKSRYDFQRALEQERKKIATNDQILDRKIDRMFEETAKVLRNYLDPKPVDELGRQVLQGPSNAGTGS